VPAWCSDGFEGYLPASLGPFGLWHQPERRQATGPWPTPRERPLPGRLSAQGIKQYWRQRLVGGTHRVGFGTREAVQHVLAVWGRQRNTS
jgi:hypothetical protein